MCWWLRSLDGAEISRNALESLRVLINPMMLAIKKAMFRHVVADWLIGLKRMNINQLTRAVNLSS